MWGQHYLDIIASQRVYGFDQAGTGEADMLGPNADDRTITLMQTLEDGGLLALSVDEQLIEITELGQEGTRNRLQRRQDCLLNDVDSAKGHQKGDSELEGVSGYKHDAAPKIRGGWMIERLEIPGKIPGKEEVLQLADLGWGARLKGIERMEDGAKIWRPSLERL